MMLMSATSDIGLPSRMRLRRPWTLAASSLNQYTSAAQSTIASPPLQRTLSLASTVVATLLELDGNSAASVTSCDFLPRGEDLVNVFEPTLDQLVSGNSSAGCSGWPTVSWTSLLTSCGGDSELDLFWRFDFFGRVKVLVSIPESKH